MIAEVPHRDAQHPVAGGVNNLNPVDSLCLDLRAVAPGSAQGTCQADDSDCPDWPGSGLSCVDDDTEPLNGGICVSRACFRAGDTVVVDVELGPTSQPACGAQLFLKWDVETLAFVSFETNPDLEFGAGTVILSLVDTQAGTMDLAVSLLTALPCNALHASSGGGTVVRVFFVAVGDCQESEGVRFRPHNPPTSVGGAGGAIPIVGCNGDTAPSATDDMAVATAPVWSCPSGSVGNAACATILREVDLPPITVTDSCGGAPDVHDLCVVEYYPACEGDLDCGRGDFCSGPADCDGQVCVPHPDAEGFICPGNVPCIGFCRVTACTAGACDAPVVPIGVDLPALLDGGGIFLPGRTEFHCSYTNDCGLSAGCGFDVVNTGLNTLLVDLQLSPTMVSGFPNNPIYRCIDFTLSRCDGVSETYADSQEVRLGAPLDLAGHGHAALDVPPAQWACVSAKDPKHSLTVRCDVDCDADGRFRTTFAGSPFFGAQCHWLVQGDLNGDEVIDILDYTLLAGRHLTVAGDDSPCGLEGVHADMNGDGLVSLADYAFPMINFFQESEGACGVFCNPFAATAPDGARRTITVQELEAMGLGEDAAWADVNGDGVVDFADVGRFLEANADEDPALARELRRAYRQKAASLGLR